MDKFHAVMLGPCVGDLSHRWLATPHTDDRTCCDGPSPRPTLFLTRGEAQAFLEVQVPVGDVGKVGGLIA